MGGGGEGGEEGSSKFDEGGLSQNMAGAWGELKVLSKIPVKEFIG